jgi:hypothetical protein
LTQWSAPGRLWAGCEPPPRKAAAAAGDGRGGSASVLMRLLNGLGLLALLVLGCVCVNTRWLARVLTQWHAPHAAADVEDFLDQLETEEAQAVIMQWRRAGGAPPAPPPPVTRSPQNEGVRVRVRGVRAERVGGA